MHRKTKKILAYFLSAMVLFTMVSTILIQSLAVNEHETTIDFLPASEEEVAQYTIKPAGYSSNSPQADGVFSMTYKPTGVEIIGYQWAVRGKSFAKPVVLDATKPIYIQYDTKQGEAGGLSFLVDANGGGAGLVNLSYLLGGKELGTVSGNDKMKKSGN